MANVSGDAHEGFSLGIDSLSGIIHEPGHDVTGVALRYQWQHAADDQDPDGQDNICAVQGIFLLTSCDFS